MNLRALYADYKKLNSNIRLVIEAAMFGTLVGFGQLWLFDLFAHFRLHYIIIFAVFGLWLFCKRAWALGLLMLSLIAFNASILLHWHERLVKPMAEASAPSLKIVAANIFGAPMSPETLRHYLATGGFDIIMLTEYSVHWDAYFNEWSLPYPYILKHPQPDNFGVAIYSRWPLTDAVLASWHIPLPMPGIIATAQTPLGPIRVIAAHPPPPVMPGFGKWRNGVITQISAIMKDSDIPVLVAGDLNATPWSYPLNELLKMPGVIGGSYYGTWPSAIPQLGLPIDHIIVKGPLAFAHYGTGPATGSDHLPLEAVLVKAP